MVYVAPEQKQDKFWLCTQQLTTPPPPSAKLSDFMATSTPGVWKWTQCGWRIRCKKNLFSLHSRFMEWHAFLISLPTKIEVQQALLHPTGFVDWKYSKEKHVSKEARRVSPLSTTLESGFHRYETSDWWHSYQRWSHLRVDEKWPA